MKRITYLALSNKVLVVAVEGSVGDWTAYIDAVAGQDHEEEMREVARHGAKIPKWMAKRLFPSFHKAFKWRP